MLEKQIACHYGLNGSATRRKFSYNSQMAEGEAIQLLRNKQNGRNMSCAKQVDINVVEQGGQKNTQALQLKQSLYNEINDRQASLSKIY